VIFLWGLEGDTPLAMVASALGERGAPLYFLDQARITRTEVIVSGDPDGVATVCDGDQKLDLERVRSIYHRPFDTRRLPAVRATAPESPAYARAIETDATLLAWCQIAHCRVVNRPAAMASNNSKPYQCELIEAGGFATPPTLVANDIEDVRDFVAEHGSVIYKSTSGVRSIVSRLDDGAEAKFADLATCPTQFQAFVPGVDVRAHVVGDQVFATEIISEADDYRYAGQRGQSVSLRPILLDADCVEALCGLTRSLGLEVAGVDLRRGDDNGWTCFEVNPSPGFSFYEQSTGQPIAGAIADLLVSGPDLRTIPDFQGWQK
jgi:hypothetical protein